MQTTLGKRFKTWSEIKEGDTIYYYDHGKLREQKVHSVENTEETYTSGGWGYISTTTYKKIIIKAGRGSTIEIYDYYFDAPYKEDYYFTRFTCKEAALDALKKHSANLEQICERAKKRYEKYLNSYNKYKASISKLEKVLDNIEQKA